MHTAYARDLDLNLLRVFVVVAEAGSVTAAAGRLYVTQPAVSAALARLARTVGAPLFVRRGRGLVLTARGKVLLQGARPHLAALAEAVAAPASFDPRTSDRTVRLGLSDSSEETLLPGLLRLLSRAAPRMQLIVLPVQFRTVGEALASGSIDLAVTVADELPGDIRRRTIFVGGFTCLYDPRHAALGRTLTLERYLAHDHVIVSYNGDLRGVVEDALGVQRRVRVSVPSFHGVGAIVDGSAILATLPERVATGIRVTRPHLRTATLPFTFAGAPTEALRPASSDDDPAVRFLEEQLALVAAPGSRLRRGTQHRGREV